MTNNRDAQQHSFPVHRQAADDDVSSILAAYGTTLGENLVIGTGRLFRTSVTNNTVTASNRGWMICGVFFTLDTSAKE